ncbi:hypothetical protein BV96_00044 [Sphingomonas paucimobilis]|nr:hypothetical protein BV96_00044 [Sphingomonas paucimobilis]
MRTASAILASFASVAALPAIANTATLIEPAPAILDIIQQQRGTWKLNLDESRDEHGQRYKTGFTVVIRSGYPIQDYTFIGEAEDGKKPYVFNFKAPPDGTVLPNTANGGTFSMELLPNGIVDAKLWSPSGMFENKFCIPYASMRKIICLATLTDKQGARTMFTNVLDKVSNSVE